MIRYLYIIIIAGLFALSCDSEDVNTNGDVITHLDSCYNRSQWDSLDIVNNLLGLWSLSSYSCAVDPGNIQYGTMYLDFKADKTLFIHTPSSQRTKYSWTIRSTASGYVIDSDETGNIVSGTILFCKEELELMNSPNGGCDQFFDKVD